MSDIRIIGNVIKGEQQHDGERVKKKTNVLLFIIWVIKDIVKDEVKDDTR